MAPDAITLNMPRTLSLPRMRIGRVHAAQKPR